MISGISANHDANDILLIQPSSLNYFIEKVIAMAYSVDDLEATFEIISSFPGFERFSLSNMRNATIYINNMRCVTLLRDFAIAMRRLTRYYILVALICSWNLSFDGALTHNNITLHVFCVDVNGAECGVSRSSTADE